MKTECPLGELIEELGSEASLAFKLVMPSREVLETLGHGKQVGEVGP